MQGVSEIDEMLVSGLVLIGQNENSITAILALLETQRQRWWMVDWRELGEELLSRNAGGVAQSRLFSEAGKEVTAD